MMHGKNDACGPALLSALEYIAHRFGIHPHLGQAWFSLGSGEEYAYESVFYDRRYPVRSDGVKAEITVDEKQSALISAGREASPTTGDASCVPSS